MNDDASSSAKPLLPESVLLQLVQGMKYGFVSGHLNLASKVVMIMITSSLMSNQITSKGAIMLLFILRTMNSNIHVVDLSLNEDIDDRCIESVGEYIKHNKSIASISLRYAHISDKGIKMLAPYLASNQTLLSLDFNGNEDITDSSIPLLIQMIESSRIQLLSVNYASITQKRAINISLASNSLRYASNKLDFDERGLKDEDIITICELMKTFGVDKLKEIEEPFKCKYTYSLYENHLTSQGASILFDTLREHKAMVIALNLGDNELDDECMKQLGEYIQDNQHLEKLVINDNRITDKGIQVLTEYLIGNVTLKKFDLGNHYNMSDASAPYLIEIAKKTYITEMFLHGTSISDDERKRIRALLGVPFDERDIPLKSNTKSAAKAQMF